jgi:hypothetical protein
MTSSLLIASLLLLPTLAPAQSRPCPPGTEAVDSRYRKNPRGLFCWVPNIHRPSRSHGFTAPRLIQGQWVQGRVPLADPTILKIGNTYFLTGTSDEYATANFPIFSSDNLVQWNFHGTAFPESNRQGDRVVIGTDRYCNLWAPELFVDPQYPETITLAFSATRDEGQEVCAQGFAPPSGGTATPRVRSSVDMVSSHVTQLDLQSFLQQLPFSSAGPIGYRMGNQDFFDGGWAASQSTGIAKGIPTTLLLGLYGTQPGQTQFLADSGRLCHNGLGCNSAIGIDVNYYVNPVNLRAHLIYTWMDGNPGSWGGLHTAAYPLSSDPAIGALRAARLDPLATGWDHLPLAYRHSTVNPIELRVGRGRNSQRLWIPNGLFGRSTAIGSVNSGYGIAEGGAAYWDSSRQRNYWVVSRNFWDSPAYGMYYRVTNRPELESHRLGSWDEAQRMEWPLLRSRERSLACGESVGHGMLFQGPGQRTFAVFHYKEAAVSGCPGQPVYPSGSPRSVFFKELSPTGDGRWLEVTNSGSQPSSRTYDGFLIPR